MFSAIPRIRLLSLAVVLIFLIFYLFWPSGDEIAAAEGLVESWNLVEAERLLEKLHERNPEDLKLNKLYGEVLLKRGDLLKSAGVFRFLLNRDSIDKISHNLHLGFAYFYLGKLDSALSKARDAMHVADRAEDPGDLAGVHHLLGLIEFNKARYDSALKHQTLSLQFARRAKHRNAEANALRQLGVLLWYRGRYDSALTAYYKPALKLYRETGDKIGQATTLSNIGLIHHDKLDGAASLKYQLEAFKIRKNMGDQRGLADSYYFLSSNSLSGRAFTFMYAYRLKSLELSTRIGYAWGREVAARALEEIQPEGFDVPETQNQLQDSILSLSGEGQLHSLWRRARLHMIHKRWKDGARLYPGVLRLCDSLGYVHGRRIALYQYAQVLLGLGRSDEALRVLLEARKTPAERIGVGYDGVEIELARVYLSRGHASNALQILQPVIHHLDSMYAGRLKSLPPEFSLEGGATAVYQWRSQAYGVLVEALAVAPVELLFAAIEREKSLPFLGERDVSAESERKRESLLGIFARLLEERPRIQAFDDIVGIEEAIGEIQLASTEAQSVFSRAAQDIQQTSPASLIEVRGALGKNEVFLDYFIADNKVFVFALRKDRARLITLSVHPKELASACTVFRESMNRGASNPGDQLWRGPAEFLGKALLQPLKDRNMVLSGDHVIVSPHGSLHLLPFHALTLERGSGNPEFAIERHSFSLVPSASWFVQQRQAQPQPMASLLAVAPLTESLPHTNEEVQNIPAKFFTRFEVMKNRRATAGEILRAMQGFDVVHIASHARVNSFHPLYSSFEGADRKLELHEFIGSKGPKRMMVLSACETGSVTSLAGEQLGSEGIISFSRVLMANKVPSVVASLWLVEDQTTSGIFGDFYNRFPESESLADRLTASQRLFLEKSRKTGIKNHPFYWAPFVLIGDGR